MKTEINANDSKYLSSLYHIYVYVLQLLETCLYKKNVNLHLVPYGHVYSNLHS
jgi:hypothetical protein